MISNEGISIIIPVFNQAKEIENNLNNIFSNIGNYKGNFEVIVISDGDKPLSDSLIKKYPIKYFKNKINKGSGQTRHFGVLQSKYDIIFFIDCDIELNKNFLNIINENIRENKLDGIIGIVNHVPINNDQVTARYIAAETNYYGNACKKEIHHFFIGLCGAIKKSVYLKNTGFYHRIIDDMEFSSRLGDEIKIKTISNLIFKHSFSNLQTNIKKLFLRSFYFSQLDKKPFSPWFTKIRKFSVFSAFLTTIFLIMSIFFESFIQASIFFLFIYCITCIELVNFKKKIIDFFLFIPIKFSIQNAIGFGFALGYLIYLWKRIYFFIISILGPFRIYLRHKKPTYLILYVTGKCNSKCSYCFQWDILNVKERVQNELTLKEYVLLSKSLGPIEHLTLGGGEPTMRPDLADIVIAFYQYSKVRNVSIPTNGIRPDFLETHVEKILSNCPKLTLKISISIDGVEKEHDKLRGVEGNYERVIESDKVLRQLRSKYINLYYIINTCFIGQNQNNVLNTIQQNKKNFDHDIQVTTFVRGSLADENVSKKININKYFEVVDYLENIQTIEKKPHNYSLDLLHQALQVESRSSIRHIMEKGEGKYSCSAGKNMIVVDELGNVNPCEILPSKFGYGNLKNFNMDVNELFKQSKVNKIQKRIKNEKCFCTWECAQLNSIAFSPKGLFNMLKHATKIHKRRKVLSELGPNISFEKYSKYFSNNQKPLYDHEKYTHPMVNEGAKLNPFNIEQKLTESNEITSKIAMDKKDLDEKKLRWLKPVKASKISKEYIYK